MLDTKAVLLLKEFQFDLASMLNVNYM